MNLTKEIQQNLPSEAKKTVSSLLATLKAKNKNAVLVGGVVRDLILGVPVTDVDFMLEHPAVEVVKEVARLLNAKIIEHDSFLTFTIHLPSGHHFDFVTAREETYSSPAKLPKVKPSSFERDLKRRDFSINAIAAWLNPEKFGETFDPFLGMADIRNKQIRVLHQNSFNDDPTRIYRAARFAARLDFQVEPATLSFIRDSVAKSIPKLLTPARLRHELEKILVDRKPLQTLRLLSDWDALKFLGEHWRILPEHELAVPPNPVEGRELLVRRLGEWLKPWGKYSAQKALQDLGFERAVKNEVLKIF